MSVATAAVAPDDASALARAHPLTMFGLDALVAGAARPRPEALALQDHGAEAHGEIAYAEIVTQAGALLSRLRAAFAPGERVLLLGAPHSRTLIALTAVIAAGLEPVLAPLHETAATLAAAARAADAVGVLSPARFAGLELEDTLLSVAAQTPSVRVLATLGGGTLDGAADFSNGAPPGDGASGAALDDGWASGERAMVGALGPGGAPVFASQGALLGHALDLVRATRAGGASPVLALVSPASLGGLVAGPLAALLAGAPLHFIAPFDGAGFLACLDAIGPARLVAPAAILPDLARGGLLTNGALLSVAALARGDAHADAFERPRQSCPIIEISRDGAARRIA